MSNAQKPAAKPHTLKLSTEERDFLAGLLVEDWAAECYAAEMLGQPLDPPEPDHPLADNPPTGEVRMGLVRALLSRLAPPPDQPA